MDSLWKAGQSKNCTHGLYHSPAHPSLSRVSPVVEGGWVLESGVQSADPGRGQLLAVKRQPEGAGVRSSTTGKVCRRSPGKHRNKVSLLSGTQGAGPPLQPPSASMGTGRDTHLSRLAPCSSQGLLCPCRLWGLEHHPCQSLLGNQPWASLPEMGICQSWCGLSAKAWG